MLNLTVKNFGVLKNIDIEFNYTNLFIGDNGSGKSTLAKLITVITDFTIDEDKIIKRLKDFNIDFLNEECFIELKEDNDFLIKIIGLKVKFSTPRRAINEEVAKYESLFHLNNVISSTENKNNLDKFLNKMAKNDNILLKDLTEFSKNKEFRKKLIGFDKDINDLKSKYIPAERNLVSLFNQSLSNFVSAEIPLPKTLLEFSAHYNSARNEIKELNILGMKYKNENSQDRIFYEDGNSLALENSSSGIQSALPLYLTLKYFATQHRDIIIEEPELNLYPKSQIETVKFMLENRGNSSLSIMTHSPYILSVLNVLLFAYKASNTNDILKDKISAIIPKEQQVNPDGFSAYLIENGTSESIKGKYTGMIQENVIDEIGDSIDEDFSLLMELYREYKNDT